MRQGSAPLLLVLPELGLRLVEPREPVEAERQLVQLVAKEEIFLVRVRQVGSGPGDGGRDALPLREEVQVLREALNLDQTGYAEMLELVEHAATLVEDRLADSTHLE